MSAVVTLALEVPQVITLGNTPACREVDIAQNVRQVVVRPRGHAGRVAYTGTHDADIGTDFQTLTADTTYTIQVPGTSGRSRNLDSSTRKLFIGADTNATVVELTGIR